MDCNLLVAQALFNRGFFINYDNGILSLSSRNHINDFYKIKDLFEDLDLKHKWENNNFIISQSLNLKQYEEISNYPARNHEVGFPEYHGTWKSFLQRKHSSKIPTLSLDPGIAILVKAISSIGISTYSSCDGHGKKKPEIFFSSYYHAAWFEYLQLSYIGNLTLNYMWYMDSSTQNDVFLTVDNPRPSLYLLQEDSVKMANILLNNEADIFQKKQMYFHDNVNQTKKYLKKKSYGETKDIINNLIQVKSVNELDKYNPK